VTTSSASARPRAGISCLSIFALAALHTHAQAAEHGVTSGGLLRQNPALTRALGPVEAPNADATQVREAQQGDEAELRFTVRDFEFNGEMTPDERARVDAYIAPLRNREATLGTLQVMRAELTELLYHDGESLVRVLLPQQTIDKNGVVRFQIVRGRIENVIVDNASQVDTARIESILRGTGVAERKLRDVEARMRLLRELPGIGCVEATLAPGKYPGGTLVTVSVAPGRTLYGSITADNFGSVEAGERRIGVVGGIDNPFGRGDRLEAMVTATPTALKTHASNGGQTRLARVSYDGPVGAGASRAGTAVSHVAYRLGGAFEGLGKGSADVASVYATRPVWRTRASSLDVSTTIDRKRLRDERFDGLLENRRESTVASARVDGSGVSGRGRWRRYFRYGVGASYGGIDMTDIDRTSTDPATRKHATFVKAEPVASIAVAPVSSLQLSAQVRGQWANRSLDGSERMSLGGPGAVRAYDLNAAAVDNGAVVSLEASHDFFLPNTRVSAFYDAASGRYRAAMGYASRSTNLQGAGVGVNWNWKGVQGQVSVARALGHSSDVPKDDQLWVTVGKQF